MEEMKSKQASNNKKKPLQSVLVLGQILNKNVSSLPTMLLSRPSQGVIQFGNKVLHTKYMYRLNVQTVKRCVLSLS